MSLKERTKSILTTTVKDFIKSGKPVTSQELCRTHNFGIKSAMLRWELHDLSKDGYLEQIHSSSGRIPSDKAYKFLVREILIALEREQERKNFCEDDDVSFEYFLDFLAQGRKNLFIKKLAAVLKVLGIGYEPSAKEIYRSGLDILFENLDIQNKPETVGVLEDVERVFERLEDEKEWLLEETEWPQVFIGKSPVTKSHNLSVVIGKIDSRDDADFLIVAVGPKRMDYEKTIRLFKYLMRE